MEIRCLVRASFLGSSRFVLDSTFKTNSKHLSRRLRSSRSYFTYAPAQASLRSGAFQQVIAGQSSSVNAFVRTSRLNITNDALVIHDLRKPGHGGQPEGTDGLREYSLTSTGLNGWGKLFFIVSVSNDALNRQTIIRRSIYAQQYPFDLLKHSSFSFQSSPCLPGL